MFLAGSAQSATSTISTRFVLLIAKHLFVCAVDVLGRMLVAVISVLLLANAVCSEPADNTSSADLCSVYRNCQTCITDPCSQRTFDKSVCAWTAGRGCWTCDHYECWPDNVWPCWRGNCASQSFDNKEASERSASKLEPAVSALPNCVFMTDAFVFDLRQLTRSPAETSYHHAWGSTGEIWINICANAETQQLSCPPTTAAAPVVWKRPGHAIFFPLCFALGSVRDMKMSLISSAKPDRGVRLQYGSAKCCSRADEQPGHTNDLPVVVNVVCTTSSVDEGMLRDFSGPIINGGDYYCTGQPTSVTLVSKYACPRALIDPGNSTVRCSPMTVEPHRPVICLIDSVAKYDPETTIGSQDDEGLFDIFLVSGAERVRVPVAWQKEPKQFSMRFIPAKAGTHTLFVRLRAPFSNVSQPVHARNYPIRIQVQEAASEPAWPWWKIVITAVSPIAGGLSIVVSIYNIRKCLKERAETQSLLNPDQSRGGLCHRCCARLCRCLCPCACFRCCSCCTGSAANSDAQQQPKQVAAPSVVDVKVAKGSVASPHAKLESSKTF